MRISDWSSDVCSSDLIPHMFYQPDLFEQSPPPSSPSSRRGAAALPDLVERISTVSKRPRYALLVLKLIAQEAGSPDSVGRSEERRVGKACVSTCRSRWSPCH